MASTISSSALPIASLDNLAPAVFGSAPSNKLAAPDIYELTSGVVTTPVINTPQGKYSSFASNLGSSLTSILGGGSSSILSSLTNFTRSGGVASLMRGNLNLSSAGVASRLSSLTGPVTSLVPGISSALGQSTNLTRGSWNSMTATIGNLTRTITSGEPMGVTSITQMIGRVTGNSALASALDIGPIASTLTTIGQSLLSYGIPEAIDEVMRGCSSSEAVTASYQQNAQSIIQSGSISSIQSMITSMGTGALLTKIPNAGLLVIQYYKIPSGTATTGYADQLTALVNVLTTLDASWLTTTRSGASIDSLAYFAVASSDALKIMKTSSTYAVQAVIGSTYKSEDTPTWLKKSFPAMLTM